MASKITCLLAVLCALQVAHAASVQKRDIFQDAINAALQPVAQIQSQIQGFIGQAQSLIQGFQTQIASVVAPVIAEIEARAKAVGDQITAATRIPGCVFTEAGDVTKIANQTGQDIQAYVTNQISTFLSKLEDMQSIGAQAAQLFQETQAKASSTSIFDIGSIINIASTAASKGLLLVSSAATDFVYLSTQLPTAAIQIPAFVTGEAAKVFQQFNDIVKSVQTCASSG